MHVWKEAPTDARPHVGDGWFERSGTVGTADERNDYLFVRRVALQLKIAQDFSNGRTLEKDGIKDIIVDVRCYTENDETGVLSWQTLSVLAANALIGKTIAEASRLRDDDFGAGTAVPWRAGYNGKPYLYADAVRAALVDWSMKATGRPERLPEFALPPPHSCQPPSSLVARVRRSLGI